MTRKDTSARRRLGVEAPSGVRAARASIPDGRIGRVAEPRISVGHDEEATRWLRAKGPYRNPSSPPPPGAPPPTGSLISDRFTARWLHRNVLDGPSPSRPPANYAQ
ncbi:hypothetical protein KM043_003856 [Ampulex compressa]|nr:hypothetical protein KM043_003856 [Ampulex compressa]